MNDKTEEEEEITLDRPKDEDLHVYVAEGSDVTLGLEKLLFHTGVPREVPSFYLDDVKLAPLLVSIPKDQADGYLKRLSEAKDFKAQYKVRRAIVEALKDVQREKAEEISRWSVQQAAAENEKRREKLCHTARIYIPGFDPDPDKAAKEEAEKVAAEKAEAEKKATEKAAADKAAAAKKELAKKTETAVPVPPGAGDGRGGR